MHRLISAGIYSMHELMASLSDDENVVKEGLNGLLKWLAGKGPGILPTAT
jgi:hypothetical protein